MTHISVVVAAALDDTVDEGRPVIMAVTLIDKFGKIDSLVVFAAPVEVVNEIMPAVTTFEPVADVRSTVIVVPLQVAGVMVASAMVICKTCTTLPAVLIAGATMMIEPPAPKWTAVISSTIVDVGLSIVTTEPRRLASTRAVDGNTGTATLMVVVSMMISGRA